jgi:DNA-binding transcriptional LysR family regulator
MELRHFKYFIAVAEALHFAQAAEKLGISAPTLTVQIQELERRLQTQLFHRNKRNVTLTLAGEAFLTEARAAVRHFERAVELGRRMGRGASGYIEIGYVASAVFPGHVQHRVNMYRRAHPDVMVSLREYAMKQLPILLVEGIIDIAFLRLPLELDPMLAAMVLHKERYCLAVPSSHSLNAFSGNIKPHHLSTENFIALEQPKGTNEIGRRGDFIPKVVATGNMLFVLVQVSLCVGIAVVPESIAKIIHMPGVTYLPIDGEPIYSEGAMVYRRDEQSQSVNAFVDNLKQQMQSEYIQEHTPTILKA